jgi:hypothetical protein
MIIIGETLVSAELFENSFVCDLNACKGACCIEGDSGAPLEGEELSNLEEVWEIVKPYMRPEGIKAIEELGLYQMDGDGDMVTTLVDGNKECAFVVFDSSGVAKCALENAYNEGKTTWKKPISCHLYPVRLKQLSAYMAVNYHRWGLCDPACSLGNQLKVPIFRFLKEPLIRKFGEEWYAEAELVYTAMEAEK